MEEDDKNPGTDVPDTRVASKAQKNEHKRLFARINKLEHQLKLKGNEIMALKKEIKHSCNEVTRLEDLHEKSRLSARELEYENHDLKEELFRAYKTIKTLKETRLNIRSNVSRLSQKPQAEYEGCSGRSPKQSHYHASTDLDAPRPVKEELASIVHEHPLKKDRVVCYNCGKEDDHYFMDCMVDCGHCGADGHKTIYCPTIDISERKLKRKAEVEEVDGGRKKRRMALR
ncbi:hypothetical protein BP6252_04719 [Coleophoma cylindrospora]|uniref:CCHC-type domain-containing protein n=1 Tax=Coleophoma cylindrospora TaxID=1849047 RepID=A0A3D8S1V4_9HELO|nr:hypothetical protein BP6252_04719 [Coleophoma cylindrospora]